MTAYESFAMCENCSRTFEPTEVCLCPLCNHLSLSEVRCNDVVSTPCGSMVFALIQGGEVTCFDSHGFGHVFRVSEIGVNFDMMSTKERE